MVLCRPGGRCFFVFYFSLTFLIRRASVVLWPFLRMLSRFTDRWLVKETWML